MTAKIGRLVQEIKLLFRSIPSILLAFTVVGIVGMNILANKSIDLGEKVGSWLALDCGIIFSWLIFLTMDVTTRRFGVKAANIVSVFALFANLLFAVILIIASYIPGFWGLSFLDDGSIDLTVNTVLDLTFRGQWFVLLGSSVAFIVSAVVNNFLHAALEKAMKDKKRALAFTVSSYVSTFVAQFVDNLLFALIVSLNFFGWTIVQCVTCAITGALVELLFEVVFSPIGYRIVKHLEDDNVGKEYLELAYGGKQNETAQSVDLGNE